MGNILDLVKEYLTDIYYNDKNNTVVDSYMNYRHDNIGIATLINGEERKMCYIYNEDIVLASKEDLFKWALDDTEWLEDIAKECKEQILEWVEVKLEDQSS